MLCCFGDAIEPKVTGRNEVLKAAVMDLLRGRKLSTKCYGVVKAVKCSTLR